jgi:hypothetical protein
MRSVLGVAFALALSAASAVADPIGTYEVSGTNPGSGSHYSGTVTVRRTGDTLLVAWDIAGTRQVGVGLGADDFLAVSYAANNSFGIAFYRPENDGWKGVLAPAGSQIVGTEIWTRVRAE